MSLRDFIAKQFIEVIEWNEPQDGILSHRYPMRDQEIMNGAKLTVRESQMAAFLNEGRMADAFGPGLYTLTTQTLPILTDLMNWDKQFKSPFKSDVYFFSTRIVTHSVIALAVASRFGWPIKQPSPTNSSAPKIATMASLPCFETTVTFTLPFLI